MYHSIRTAVNISDVSQNECPIQPRTILCSTCEPNHYRVKLRHRAKHSIRASAHGMYSRSEPNFWLSIHQENSELVNNTSISDIPAEIRKKETSQSNMHWPCSHRWGSRKCNNYVKSVGARCQDCQVCTCADSSIQCMSAAVIDETLLIIYPPIQKCRELDSTPTHTRLAHMYDVETFVRGFRNAELNAACIVVMMRDGALERALLDALAVIQENDTEWYDRIKYVVPQGISQYKEEANGWA
ncbi:uncharacterized protein FOBCDRAFT_217652 [Fusarium oxysporum Fo47]|uniref:Uncharacterized protein n=1 Tax=Fusarium oxysporum Fo47 TaxID=660027 RepID=W9KTB5_FUSOX|nr:uncharacterized protein FOBCDRAFT_217652 [Fusarium oxysporum Fo47]EWZ44383.1 hypothetical protein FOZG_05197 [Fusarium oxysporum Fo47]QKD51131.1 hypothetical protein FOBCDRAFT_217652 [Fusarium oxysporum Fo47]